MLAVFTFAACTNSNEKMKKCENDTWDKVFPLSEKVNHKKVSFQNQYGFTLVGDLYTPKSVSPQDGLSAERSVSETVCQQSGLPARSSGNRGVRSFRGNQRAEFGAVCHEDGGARVYCAGF